jgi:hypothetical protein
MQAGHIKRVMPPGSDNVLPLSVRAIARHTARVVPPHGSTTGHRQLSLGEMTL